MRKVAWSDLMPGSIRLPCGSRRECSRQTRQTPKSASRAELTRLDGLDLERAVSPGQCFSYYKATAYIYIYVYLYIYIYDYPFELLNIPRCVSKCQCPSTFHVRTFSSQQGRNVRACNSAACDSCGFAIRMAVPSVSLCYPVLSAGLFDAITCHRCERSGDASCHGGKVGPTQVTSDDQEEPRIGGKQAQEAERGRRSWSTGNVQSTSKVLPILGQLGRQRSLRPIFPCYSVNYLSRKVGA